MAIYERDNKKSHLHTIWYEIGMLDFIYSVIRTRIEQLPKQESNLYVEGFLLHYRNLIEFFSGNPEKRRKPKDKKTTADLSTSAPEPWAERKLTNEEIEKIQTPPRGLQGKYWHDISQFLQHCTERRSREFRDWDLDEMFAELTPVISAFRSSFPPPED